MSKSSSSSPHRLEVDSRHPTENGTRNLMVPSARQRASYNDLTKKKLYGTSFECPPTTTGHRLRSNTAPSYVNRPRSGGALNSLVHETFKITTSQFKFRKRPPPVFLEPVQLFPGDDGATVFIGSTNSVGFGIRSAPSSPMAPLQGQSETNEHSLIGLNAVIQSPSHPAIGSKLDSKSLKHLPAPVTASSTNRSISPHPQKSSSTSSKNDVPPEKEKKKKELSSSRQKKFHRHFQQVSKDERVINYYSCALVSDILLQGHLYITDNYFAFYSNVFGFVTKLLIPTASVVRISKEKTAKIIPNAVGVATADERHVFGSFMSREAAFRLMCSVCQPLELPEIIPKVPDIEVSEECSVEDDSSCSISGNESPPQAIDSTSDASQPLRQRAITSNYVTPADSIDGEVKTDIPHDSVTGTAAATTTSSNPVKSSQSPPPRLLSSRSFKLKFPTDLHIVYLGVILTVILTIFSAFLLYRILDFEARNRNYSHLDFKWGSESDVDGIYAEALRWQKEMQTRSTEEAQIILNSNLQQIARVRRNLETLSLLIHDSKIPPSQPYADRDSDDTINTNHRGYYETKSKTAGDTTVDNSNNNSEDYGLNP